MDEVSESERRNICETIYLYMLQALKPSSRGFVETWFMMNADQNMFRGSFRPFEGQDLRIQSSDTTSTVTITDAMSLYRALNIKETALTRYKRGSDDKNTAAVVDSERPVTIRLQERCFFIETENDQVKPVYSYRCSVKFFVNSN